MKTKDIINEVNAMLKSQMNRSKGFMFNKKVMKRYWELRDELDKRTNL